MDILERISEKLLDGDDQEVGRLTLNRCDSCSSFFCHRRSAGLTDSRFIRCTRAHPTR